MREPVRRCEINVHVVGISSGEHPHGVNRIVENELVPEITQGDLTYFLVQHDRWRNLVEGLNQRVYIRGKQELTGNHSSDERPAGLAAARLRLLAVGDRLQQVEVGLFGAGTRQPNREGDDS